MPLLVIAGKEYGSGSSRDWAAKGTLLLGVKAVIAESFERIHRSNLVNMGVLPLQFKAGETAASLKLTGTEEYTLVGAATALKPRGDVRVRGDGAPMARAREFTVTARDRHAGGTGGVPPRRDSSRTSCAVGRRNELRYRRT